MYSLRNAAKKLSMTKYVLDASVVLAYLNEETGAELVAPILEQGNGVLSAVNYAEVATKLLQLGLSEQVATQVMQSLGIVPLSFDAEVAWISAKLISLTKPFGLSLGDRACLALAKHLQLPVMTADKVWAALDLNVEITLIR